MISCFSLALINFRKGEELFSVFKDKVDCKEVELDGYIQKNMQEPSRPHRSVPEFWNDYDNKSLSFIIKKYGDNNLLLNYRYIN